MIQAQTETAEENNGKAGGSLALFLFGKLWPCCELFTCSAPTTCCKFWSTAIFREDSASGKVVGGAEQKTRPATSIHSYSCNLRCIVKTQNMQQLMQKVDHCCIEKAVRKISKELCKVFMEKRWYCIPNDLCLWKMRAVSHISFVIFLLLFLK